MRLTPRDDEGSRLPIPVPSLLASIIRLSFNWRGASLAGGTHIYDGLLVSR